MGEEINKALAERLNQESESLSIQQTLEMISQEFNGKVCFSTSFGMEDQVITDMVFSMNLPIKVFTLDTGRHFEETYKVHNRTLAQYDKKIQVYHPDAKEVELLLSSKGPYSFYESVENRKECCHIRKVEPLKRALEGNTIWITGIRRQQSSNRQDLSRFELDEANQIVKYNPLIDWSLEDCQTYVKEHHVPYNVLFDRGFVSIGCAPCTRAISPGQDFRAGRWWWEDNTSKECGLHASQK